MMIRLALHNGVGPVQLLHKKQAYHLVRKCHARKGYLVIGPLVNGSVKAIRPAYDEDQIGRCTDLFFIDVSRKLG